MTKSKKNIAPDSEIAFNNLPFLPPNKDKIETVKVLRQLVKSSVGPIFMSFKSAKTYPFTSSHKLLGTYAREAAEHF